MNNKKNINYYEKIKRILHSNYCNNENRIKFALYCATDLDKYYNVNKYLDVYNARRKCLDLVQRYLDDKSSVSVKDLKFAADAAILTTIHITDAIAYAAVCAAADAACTTYSAVAISATHASAICLNDAAIRAVADAACVDYRAVAISAANAAYYAGKNKTKLYKEQYAYLLQITKLDTKL